MDGWAPYRMGIVSRRVVAVAVFVGVLAGVVAAAGGAAGLASVGQRATGSASIVDVRSVDGRRVFPGGPAQTLAVAIRSDHAAKPRIAASISTDDASGDARDSSGAAIPGCLARWFKVTVAAGTRIDLTMIDAGVNQDACEGRAPAVLVARLSS